MKNKVLDVRINSISGSYVHEYLQIPFGLNAVDVCPANESMLWWKCFGKGTGEKARDVYCLTHVNVRAGVDSVKVWKRINTVQLFMLASFSSPAAPVFTFHKQTSLVHHRKWTPMAARDRCPLAPAQPAHLHCHVRPAPSTTELRGSPASGEHASPEAPIAVSMFPGKQLCLSSFLGNKTSCTEPAGSVLTPPRHTSSWREPVGFAFWALSSHCFGDKAQ